MPFNLQHIYMVHFFTGHIHTTVKNMISTLSLESLEYVQRLCKQILMYYTVV